MDEELEVQQHADVGDLEQAASDDEGRYRVYPNGVVKDMWNGGKFVAMDNSKNPAAITKDNTQEMHKLRRERARESISSAIIQGTQAIDLSDGIEKLSLPLVDVVLKGGNRSVEAWRALLQGAGLAFDTKERAEEAPASSGMTVTLGADALETLARVIQEEMQRRNSAADDYIDVG